MLHEALSVAESTGAAGLVIEACRESGYIEIQAGRAATAAAGCLAQAGTPVAVQGARKCWASGGWRCRIARTTKRRSGC